MLRGVLTEGMELYMCCKKCILENTCLDNMVLEMYIYVCEWVIWGGKEEERRRYSIRDREWNKKKYKRERGIHKTEASFCSRLEAVIRWVTYTLVTNLLTN